MSGKDSEDYSWNTRRTHGRKPEDLLTDYEDGAQIFYQANFSSGRSYKHLDEETKMALKGLVAGYMAENSRAAQDDSELDPGYTVEGITYRNPFNMAAEIDLLQENLIEEGLWFESDRIEFHDAGLQNVSKELYKIIDDLRDDELLDTDFIEARNFDLDVLKHIEVPAVGIYKDSQDILEDSEDDKDGFPVVGSSDREREEMRNILSEMNDE